VEDWELDRLLKDIFRMLREIREILEQPTPPPVGIATRIIVTPGVARDN
jgi:hypothetical protein